MSQEYERQLFLHWLSGIYTVNRLAEWQKLDVTYVVIILDRQALKHDWS